MLTVRSLADSLQSSEFESITFKDGILTATTIEAEGLDLWMLKIPTNSVTRDGAGTTVTFKIPEGTVTDFPEWGDVAYYLHRSGDIREVPIVQRDHDSIVVILGPVAKYVSLLTGVSYRGMRFYATPEDARLASRLNSATKHLELSNIVVQRLRRLPHKECSTVLDMLGYP